MLRRGRREEGSKLAVQQYQKAIDHKAPQRIEAYQRRASLFRDRLNQPEEADRVIKAMVDADPDNYQVYLATWALPSFAGGQDKGYVLRRSLLSDAKSDFDEAMKRTSSDPEVYLELARSPRTNRGTMRQDRSWRRA